MIGETFAHFRVTAKLGEHGMAKVFRVRGTTLGRDVYPFSLLSRALVSCAHAAKTRGPAAKGDQSS